MKFLLVLVAVAVLVWLVRARIRGARGPAPGAPSAERPQPMLACAQCGLHLPKSDALPGRGGVFCSDAHRAEYEKVHPA